MDLLKKNPLFSGLCLLFVLIFLGGAFLAFSAKGAKSEAERNVLSSQRQLDQVLSGVPAPSPENVALAEANVAELEAELARIREDLQRGSRLNVSEDGVRVMASIQKYITDYQNEVEDRRVPAENGDGEEVRPIVTPDNFGFGFEKFIDEAPVPEDLSVIRALDKQRQILSYILDQLIAADPQAITAVRRESVESPDAEAQSGSARAAAQRQGFRINSAMSARVPGAIDTMAFQVSFTGKTDVLREFLNRLSDFKLPIVVRGVEVSRAEASESNTPAAASRNNLDDIFGVFGGGDADGAAEAEPDAPQQTTVVSENESDFTVTLEFIEIVAPEGTSENEPA